jgi:hypothetical protein
MTTTEVAKALFSEIAAQADRHVCDPYDADPDEEGHVDPMCRACQALYDRFVALVTGAARTRQEETADG